LIRSINRCRSQLFHQVFDPARFHQVLLQPPPGSTEGQVVDGHRVSLVGYDCPIRIEIDRTEVHAKICQRHGFHVEFDVVGVKFASRFEKTATNKTSFIRLSRLQDRLCDCLEERRAVALELDLPDAGDVEELVRVARAPLTHLDERDVAEDHVRGDALLHRNFLA